MKKQTEEKDYRRYLTLVGTPLILVVAPIVGFFLGDFLDKEFNTSPYLMYGFLFLGIVAGVKEFYKLIRSLDDIDKS